MTFRERSYLASIRHPPRIVPIPVNPSDYQPTPLALHFLAILAQREANLARTLSRLSPPT